MNSELNDKNLEKLEELIENTETRKEALKKIIKKIQPIETKDKTNLSKN